MLLAEDIARTFCELTPAVGIMENPPFAVRFCTAAEAAQNQHGPLFGLYMMQ